MMLDITVSRIEMVEVQWQRLGSSFAFVNSLVSFTTSFCISGYIYSETYAADLFSKFSALPLDNKTVVDIDLGKKYRDNILSPCATIDGEKMLRDFLGRAPSKEAFLNRYSS